MAAGAGALALAALCAVGAYAAASSGAGAGAGGLGRGALVSAVTSELGITPAQLRSDLAAGQTLSQIANANGATGADLEQTILGVVQNRLQEAVGAGKLSSQQEQTLLTRAGALVDRLVGVSHPVARLARLRLRQRLVRLAAASFGITPKQLRSQIASGSSLSRVLASDGVSASNLEQSLLASAKTRLDAAVSSGKLTAVEEQTLLSRLQSQLDALLGQG
jgi:hypothetical protein